MFGDRDFDATRQSPSNEPALRQDLELDVLYRAMAGDDAFVFDVVQKALLDGLQNDIETIRYRQDVLTDCLANPGPVRTLYELAGEAIEQRKKHWFGMFAKSPSSVLSGSIGLLQSFIDMLEKFRDVSEQEAWRFKSAAFTKFFSMLREELADEFVEGVRSDLKELKFPYGLLLSAELGDECQGANYVLLKPRGKRPGWLRRNLQRLIGRLPAAHTFYIADRDDAGARILGEMRDRGINGAANALGQSADHLMNFFNALRTELAFYVGCLNLHARLTSSGAPICFPEPGPPSTKALCFAGLYDVSLALHMGQSVVGNAANADHKNLVIVTGANQGGKSTFLRSIGLAQLMMQSGSFVAAQSFHASLCPAVFTHYRRSEDATMTSGKFDEELVRMSDIVDQITPGSMVLFNESFSATNEREGSEIARQIVCALMEQRVRVVFVTHLYEFAHGFFDRMLTQAAFLRAERQDDGTRSFRLVEGEPLERSYGEDLYRQIFSAEATINR